MKREILISPFNSIILVMDKTIGKVPESMNHGLFSATESCLAIGTLSYLDGMTSIMVSNETEENDCEKGAVFNGVLNTPSGKLSICNVLNESLLDYDVPWQFTKIQVCANDATEPDVIRIFLSPGSNLLEGR